MILTIPRLGCAETEAEPRSGTDARDAKTTPVRSTDASKVTTLPIIALVPKALMHRIPFPNKV